MLDHTDTIQIFRMTDHERRIDMSHVLHCTAKLSINDKPSLSCIPITAEHALYLNTSGPVFREDAIVVLSLNRYEELEISNLTEIDVYLERSGRRCHLHAAHPVRICENDIIYIEDTSIRIIESTYIEKTPSPAHKYISLLGLVSAVACSLTVFCACQKSNPPENQKVEQAPITAQDSCENDTQKCIDDAPYICKDHTWKQLKDCFGYESCVEKSKTEAICEVFRNPGALVEAPCKEGAYKCQDGSVSVCDKNEAGQLEWIDLKKCDGNTVCVESEDKAECVEKSKACHYTQCNIPVGKDTGICTFEQTMCFNNNIYRCFGDRWKLQETCFSPARCQESDDGKFECADAEPCTDGDYACDKEKIYQCKDKKWGLYDTCKNDLYCRKRANDAPECVKQPSGSLAPLPDGNECKDGDTKCDSKTGVVKCFNGYWRFTEICGPKLLCQKEEGKQAACTKPMFTIY